MGNAPITTEAIAATNSAKRCQAAGTRPSGTGENQRPRTRAQVTARATVVLRSPAAALIARRPPADPPREVHGPALNAHAVLGGDDVLPGERVLALEARVAPGAPRDGAEETPPRPQRLALQPAEEPVAVLVGPDRSGRRSGPGRRRSRWPRRGSPRLKPSPAVSTTAPETSTMAAAPPPSTATHLTPARGRPGSRERAPLQGRRGSCDRPRRRRAGEGEQGAAEKRCPRPPPPLMTVVPGRSWPRGRGPWRSAPRSGSSSRGAAPGSPGPSSSPRRRARWPCRSRSPG